MYLLMLGKCFHHERKTNNELKASKLTASEDRPWLSMWQLNSAQFTAPQSGLSFQYKAWEFKCLGVKVSILGVLPHYVTSSGL